MGGNDMFNSKKVVLILAASPLDLPRLRTGKEFVQIDEACKRSASRTDFSVIQDPLVTWEGLPRTLLDNSPSIVIFCGHSTTDVIQFENSDGLADTVNPNALAELFSQFKSIKCVIFNSCCSDNHAQKVSEYIDYTVGMQGKVDDTDAIKFSTVFFDAIFAGRDYKNAFNIADSSMNSTLPKLFTRTRKPTNFLKEPIIARSKKKYNQYMKQQSMHYHEGKPEPLILPYIDVDIEYNDSTIPVREYMNMMLADNLPHVQIIGEGGMGKTSALISLWEKLLDELDNDCDVPIPCMLSLQLVNYLSSRRLEDYILRCIAESLFYDRRISDEHLNLVCDELAFELPDKNSPDYVILIDGFNEVKAEYQPQVAVQIRQLMENCPNLMIILTSRIPLDANFSVFGLPQVILKPLDDKKIKKYLSNTEHDISKAKLVWNLLRTPMMLTVYCETCTFADRYRDVEYFRFSQSISVEGELIQNYIEALVCQNYKRDPDKKFLVTEFFIMCFLLPEIAEFMERRQIFEINGTDFGNQIQKILKRLKSSKILTKWYDERDLEEEKDMLFTLTKDTIRKHLRLYPTLFVRVINPNRNHYWKFTHQNYRDFFSAKYVISECEIALEKGVFPSAFNRRVPLSVLRYMGDIALDYLNVNKITYFKDPLHRLVEQMRGKQSRNYKQILNNIIKIWMSRGVDGENFSNIDLHGQVFYNALSYKRYGRDTLFNHSHAYRHNFFLDGHTQRINSAVYSPDGLSILSASDDATARVWDASSGALLYTLQGYGKEVLSAQYSNKTGNLALTISQCGDAFLWDIENESKVHTFRLKSGGYITQKAVFSFDNLYIATVSDTNGIDIWDVGTGKHLRELCGHTDRIMSISSSPVSSHIITASKDSTARIWNVQTGERGVCFEGHSGWVRDARFNHDGTLAVTASSDQTAWIWDVKNGQPLHKLSRHEHTVSMAVFASASNLVATVSYDFNLFIWNGDTGEALHGPLRGHWDKINSVTFSADASSLITSSWDKSAIVWNVSTGTQRLPLGGHLDCVKYADCSIDSQHILTVSDDKTFRVWDLGSGSFIFDVENKTIRIVNSAVCTDGAMVAVALSTQLIMIWNVLKKSIIQMIEFENKVTKMQFSRRGTYLLINNMIWDVHAGKCLYKINSRFHEIGFSYNEELFWLSSDRLETTIYITKSGEKKSKINCGQNIADYFFVANDDFILTIAQQSINGKADIDIQDEELEYYSDELFGNQESTIMETDKINENLLSLNYQEVTALWAVENGEIVNTFTELMKERFTLQSNPDQNRSIQDDVFSLLPPCISPDRKLFAAGTGDGVIEVMNIEQHEFICELKLNNSMYCNDHQDSIDKVKCEDILSDLYFLLSNDQLVTVSGNDDKIDNTYVLWDINKGTIVCKLKKDELKFDAVHFSNNGKYAALTITLADEKKVEVWNTSDKHRLFSIPIKNKDIGEVIYTPDDQYFVVFGSNCDAHMYNALDGIYLGLLTGSRFEHHYSSRYNMVFFIPGTYILVKRGKDYSISIWNCELCIQGRNDVIDPMLLFHYGYNPNLIGSSFSNARFDDEMTTQEISLLKQYGRSGV